MKNTTAETDYAWLLPEPPAPARVTTAAAAATSAPSVGSGGGVAAAQQSEARGYINPLNRRAKFVLTGAARRTVLEKMRSLEANSYAAICGRVAAWEGPVRPDPDTGDAAYDAELRQFWKETQVDVEEYDQSGKFNAESYQEMMETQILVMGDALSVFVDNRDGWPAVRFYDALSVDSPLIWPFGRDWIDGVKVDRDHRHLAYQILDDSTADQWAWRSQYDIVDAAHAWFHAGWKHPGHVRCASPFLAAINPMIDLQEIDAAVVELIKVASLVGMSVETPDGGADAAPPPIAGPWSRDVIAPSRPAATGAATDPAEVPVYTEEVIGGPRIARLRPGQKLNLHNVDRDVPTYEETRGGTLEKIAMCLGLPASMCYGLFTGRFGGTGPAVRLTIGDSHVWRDRRLARRVPFVKLDYARRIEYAMRKRLIPRPKRSVLRPFRCVARFSEAYTIDIGRNTAEDKVRLSLGATSLKQLAGRSGRDALTVMNERLEELEYMWNQGVKVRGLPQSIVFPDSRPETDPASDPAADHQDAPQDQKPG